MLTTRRRRLRLAKWDSRPIRYSCSFVKVAGLGWNRSQTEFVV